MRLTKRQLKRIIREEYSRLKRRGLIKEMNLRDGASDLMAMAQGAFADGDGDGLVNHWMETLGQAAFETGEVDEEDFMAIQRFEEEYDPNQYDEGLMMQLMRSLSQDAIDLLYGG